MNINCFFKNEIERNLWIRLNAERIKISNDIIKFAVDDKSMFNDDAVLQMSFSDIGSVDEIHSPMWISNNQLDYDETVKALRSIQSKKTLTRWLTTVEGDNDEFRNAEKIEKMLIERRSLIKPVDNEFVRKTEVQMIIDTIESSGKLSQERILELLKTLV